MPRKKRHEYTFEEMVELCRENPDCKWPSFQFYPANFLGSNKVSMMSTEALGAYVVLLCREWQEDDCGLPTDDASLSLLSRTYNHWEDLKEQVLRCFRLYDGRLYNEKLVFCRTESIHIRHSRIRARMSKNTPTSVPTIVGTSEVQTSVSVSVSDSRSKEGGSKGGNGKLPEPLRSAVAGWVEQRTANKKKPTARAIELAVNRAETLCPGDIRRQAELFDHATEHQWSGLYWPKEWGEQPSAGPEDIDEDPLSPGHRPMGEQL